MSANKPTKKTVANSVTAKAHVAYPDQTKGSAIAAKARRAVGQLDHAKRQKLLNAGLSLIYGSTATQTVKAGVRH